MKNKILGLALLGAASPSLAAGPWKFTPHIYARGGITLDSDFSRSTTTGRGEAWNMGPWNQESNLFSNPLTEITLDAEYGEQFKFTYGVEVDNNNRNYESNGETRTPVNERLAYLTYYFGDNSIWFGSRPYRSEAEYLTRAFNFDNLDLYGGGIRFERLGPINLEFTYGTFENSFANEEGVNFQDNVNVVINKVEVPLSNGMIKTNLELQQTMRTSAATTNVEDRTHGYLAGISYQRWGDTVLGGGLYNQFLAHYSKGYVQRNAMTTAFNQFDPDFAAKKYLVQWNGDWKSGSVGLYWSAIAQQHMGKDPNEVLSDDEMKWAFADLIVRPQMAITSNLTGGVEYARRAVLEEGDAIRQDNFDWAANTGTTRWAGLLNYNMDNATFNNPVITLAVGEVIKDKETQFFSSKKQEKSTHFVRLNYEININ